MPTGEQLANQGVRAIIAGFDMISRGAFGPMPHLMAMAEYVTKVHAICMHCGELATFSHRTHVSQELVLLGETDSYEPQPQFDSARAAQEQPAAQQQHGQ